MRYCREFVYGRYGTGYQYHVFIGHAGIVIQQSQSQSLSSAIVELTGGNFRSRANVAALGAETVAGEVQTAFWPQHSSKLSAKPGKVIGLLAQSGTGVEPAGRLACKALWKLAG